MRTDPERILETIQEEEEKQNMGHLKIFFGYAAGVGKTYTMLRAAHSAKSRGVDVVCGYIEPHARPETLQMAEGLETIPPKEIPHGGILLREFDLDKALARKPKLILVDELAHTNAPGSRHEKRYKDVEELLKAGIDVYTTVNVQHIESLNDMVEAITGIAVRERIPDSVFDHAGQVELVDIEPEELIQRLHAGKVYKEEQADRALENFFTEDNLTALREIALRRCADRVNLLAEKSRNLTNADYYSDEHILVCLSSSPSNKKIIRTAARMAKAFRGTLTALFVETPDFQQAKEADKQRLQNHIRLATQMGARVETVYGDDIPQQIVEFARISGVSKIVIGRNNAKRRLFFTRPSLTDKLIEASPNLEVYVIPDKDVMPYTAKRRKARSYRETFSNTLRAAAVFVLASLVGLLFYHLEFRESNIIMVYILAVLFTAMLTDGRIYSILLSICSVLVFNFLFTVPRFSFSAYDSGYPVTFLVMLATAFITSTLVVRLKQYTRQAVQTSFRTKVLLETNQILQSCHNREEIAETTARQLVRLLDKDIVFYLVNDHMLGEPIICKGSMGAPDSYYTDVNEKAVAAWVLKNNKHAGATTDTLSNARCLYLAVRINDDVYGVVGIAMEHGEPLEAFENNIVLSIIGESAMMLESEKIYEDKVAATLLAKNEQLRANLLRSISHDLRTPLTSISGNAGILLASRENLAEEKKTQLYNDIYQDSIWLINLVENLLSVTRIEDGTMNLNIQAELMDEVIDEALRHIDRRKAGRRIMVDQPDDFILARMDARLIVQVIINLVDNAVKYTPEDSEITIKVRKVKDQVVVSVADNGDGLSEEAKERVFEMFYTAGNAVADSRRSLGLGLALCKSIISAHGGEICVYDNKPKGAVFQFTLPAEEVTLHE